jgi:hypothetical protein
MKKNRIKPYFIIMTIWLFFIVSMSLSVLTKIIDTYTYLLYSFILLYLFYIYVQIKKN